jgi:hypothetical protein
MGKLSQRLDAIDKRLGGRRKDTLLTADMICAYLGKNGDWDEVVATVPPDHPLFLFLDELRRNPNRDEEDVDDLDEEDDPKPSDVS